MASICCVVGSEFKETSAPKSPLRRHHVGAPWWMHDSPSPSFKTSARAGSDMHESNYFLIVRQLLSNVPLALPGTPCTQSTYKICRIHVTLPAKVLKPRITIQYNHIFVDAGVACCVTVSVCLTLTLLVSKICERHFERAISVEKLGRFSTGKSPLKNRQTVGHM